MITGVSMCCPTKSQRAGYSQTEFGNAAEKLAPRVPMELIRRTSKNNVKPLVGDLFKPLAMPLKKDFESIRAYKDAIRDYYIELIERSAFLDKFRDKNGHINYEGAIAALKGEPQKLHIVT